LVILLLVSALGYLNQVGLPDFVKRPLLEKLHSRGIDLQFTRLRLRWYRGIVAENVRFESANEPLTPQLKLNEVEVRLNHTALRHLQVQVDSLALRQGTFIWPLSDTNRDPSELSIENIQTDLRFLPDDQWALDNFTADFAAARIRLSGQVVHASAIRDWKFLSAAQPALAGTWQRRLRSLAETLERIHFAATPELVLNLTGDGRDPQSFNVRLDVSAPDAQTPWGAVAQGQFTARMFPGTNGAPNRAELRLSAAGAQSRWAGTSNLQLTIHLSSDQTNLVRGDLSLVAEHAKSEWGSASNVQLAAQWVHALTNPVPLSGQAQLSGEDVRTLWTRSRTIQLNTRLAPTPPTAEQGDESWGWWEKLDIYPLDWVCVMSELESPKLPVKQISCSGSWRAPALTITNMRAAFENGNMDLEGVLDVATRRLKASFASDVDPHALEPVLDDAARDWLTSVSWDKAPRIRAEASLVLPAWNDPNPDWHGQVQPTLCLTGEFALPDNASYRGVSLSSACARFSYCDLIWRLSDLEVIRPEGRIQAVHRSDDRTGDFYWQLYSTIHPRIFNPLLQEDQQQAFDLLVLKDPPSIQAEIWGRWHEPDRIGIKAKVALTNFTFRGQSADGLQTELQYTNRLLQFFNPRVQRGPQRMSLDGLAADFNEQLIHLTNGWSTAEPLVIARGIGDKIGQAVEPYQFLVPPLAHVYGTVPMHGELGANMHFELDGGPFHWWRFNLPHVKANLHWVDEHLDLEDVDADFYGGKAMGAAAFDFQPGGGADLHFAMATTNVILQFLMADLFSKSNHLEGILKGSLSVAANSEALHSAYGHGHLDLRNGLIWEIPLFGVFSPALDAIVPGLGNSRASAATCNFVMTNGVVHSEDLEMRAPTLRLLYKGTIDLDGQVNARVEAELLRDMWGLGPVISTVFWPVSKMFEYKVTGSIDQPKTEPLFLIPKLMLLPLHPIQTLKDFMPARPGYGTNAPPTGAQP
jgi:hypothetical protein